MIIHLPINLDIHSDIQVPSDSSFGQLGELTEQ